jgi:hypothetical protein
MPQRIPTTISTKNFFWEKNVKSTKVYKTSVNGMYCIGFVINKLVVFHAKKDSATNANAHLAHLQAQTHKLMLQLAKEPNFCRRL